MLFYRNTLYRFYYYKLTKLKNQINTLNYYDNYCYNCYNKRLLYRSEKVFNKHFY